MRPIRPLTGSTAFNTSGCRWASDETLITNATTAGSRTVNKARESTIFEMFSEISASGLIEASIVLQTSSCTSANTATYISVLEGK